jgi:hypothetical protein
MKRIENTTEINAPVERVWDLVSDVGSYVRWNPFLVDGMGDPREGGRIDIWAQLPRARKPSHFHCRVEACRPRALLRWRTGVPGIVAIVHTHEFRATDTQHTVYVHTETFRGIGVPFLRRQLRDAAVGHSLMNAAVKRKAEAGARTRLTAGV